MSDKKILLVGLIGLVLIVGIGVAYVQLTAEQNPDYEIPGPESTVRLYFESWGKKDWPNMYSAISDGFKKIDPDAKDLALFRNFAESQGITGISILNLKEVSNDGTTAVMEYSVEFMSSDGKRPFTDSFTLKYRQGDIIPGWKLIHPYGPNIDTS